MSTPAEIAHVGRVSAASAGVLTAHARGRDGLCAACRDRVHPCSRWVQAQRSLGWCTRRIKQINAELDTRSALLTPTMLLPVLRRSAIAPAERRFDGLA